VIGAGAGSARATDQIYFSSSTNVTDLLVQRINAETVRIDMSCWYLTEHSISIALLNRFKAGVPVRLMGDRGSIFEIDVHTRNEFYWLASQGVPIRLRYNPTWYPEIDHWKATIFAGQNLVAFGSGNYTPFELAPASSTNYKDEVFLFTDDPSLTGAFKTKFDQMWNDTLPEPESLVSAAPYYKNWDDACALESACSDYTTQYPTRTPMVVTTARLEPDNPLPPEMVWGQGPDFNNRMVQEINSETAAIALVSYRLTVPNITDALIARFNAGVPTRMIVEPNEYVNRAWPEFWLTHAYVDKLYAAGVPLKQRKHDGLTHMKVLVTSKYATVASSNFAAAWQRDHDYFLPAASKPAAYDSIKTQFDAMWGDTVNFAPFTPLPPDAATLSSPANGATGQSTSVTLAWNAAAFATSYDVYLGTSQGSLMFVGNVPAQLVNNPPPTYSFAPAAPLSAGTTYYWKIVSRTNATVVNSAMVANSSIGSFSTGGTTGGTPTPYGGTPAAVPGIVEAERFDDGGEGVAYHDVDAGNSGGQFRATDVDIEATSDTNGGFDVGWIAPGEWLNYTVNVAAAGSYQLDARVAAAGQGGTFHVEVGGVNKTGSLTIPNTGGWQAWTTVGTTVSLSAGVQTLKLVWDSSGPTGIVGNLNFLKFASTTGGPPPPSNVVIYASDIPSAAWHGSWSSASDASSPNGVKMVTSDLGVSNASAPLAAPVDYVDVVFNASAATPYTLWLRLRALADSKFNDSLWVQFSDANVNGSPAYGTNSSSGLLVNLATDSTGSSLIGWGWQNGAYWLSQPVTVTFASSGSHTIRIQVREDGVEFDQIVLSPSTYLNAAPGTVSGDSTIVPKP
jgi:hypothetical protein